MADMIPRVAGVYEFACEKGLGCFKPEDVARMKLLIELSFGRKLVEGYMDMDDFRGVVLEKGFKSIALIREIPGIPYSYLCKFATDPEKRTNGVGKALWTVLKTEFEPFIWRVAQANAQANEWYSKRGAQGPIPVGKWNVYWSGAREEDAAGFVQRVAAVPETLVAAK
jgi:acetylglutamate synthase